MVHFGLPTFCLPSTLRDGLAGQESGRSGTVECRDSIEWCHQESERTRAAVSGCVLRLPDSAFWPDSTSPVTAVGSGGRRNTCLKFICRSLES